MKGAPRDESAERTHRLTRARQLRRTLKDRRWHSNSELAKCAGHRFGSALLTVRRGQDGGAPWHVEKMRLSGDGARWAYRWTGRVLARVKRTERRCPHCSRVLQSSGGGR